MTAQWSGWQRDLIHAEERGQRKWSQKYGLQYPQVTEIIETVQVQGTPRDYPPRTKQIRTTTTRIMEPPSTFTAQDELYADAERPPVRTREVWVKKVVPVPEYYPTSRSPRYQEDLSTYREYHRQGNVYDYQRQEQSQHDRQDGFFLDTPRDYHDPRQPRPGPDRRPSDNYVVNRSAYRSEYAHAPTKQLSLSNSGTSLLSKVGQKKLVGVTVRETQRGCLVKSVEHGQAAERAGLRVGDTLTFINDRPVRSLHEFKSLMDKASNTLTMEVERKGQNVLFTVRR